MRFGFPEAPREEALELLLRRAPGVHQPIELLVNAGFDEQRGFDESRIVNAASPPCLELAENNFGDSRVHDGVEAIELGLIREDNRAKLCAVHAPRRIDDRTTKFLNDSIVGGLAGFDELVRQPVGVQNREAHFAEHGGDGAFAAGDAAGEAKSEHLFFDYRAEAVDCVAENFGEARRRRAALTVLLISMVMVMGPTPPGTGVRAPAMLIAAGWTSPTRALPLARNFSRRSGKSRKRRSACLASVTRLVPTSITAAPGLIQSGSTKPAFPMAATTISARRRTSGRPRVLEWQIVTVALACIRRSAMGLPTMSLRPRTTALAPSI